MLQRIFRLVFYLKIFKFIKKTLDFLRYVIYNIQAFDLQIRRVVRAGRRSTIGNRVTGYNLFEGSNPLLSAMKKAVTPFGVTAFLFAEVKKGFEGRAAQSNSPVDCCDRERPSDRSRANRISCSPPEPHRS